MGNELRDSDYGGTSHAGEYETSLYLALKPELVEMDKAVDERSPLSPSFRTDLLGWHAPRGIGCATDTVLEPADGQRGLWGTRLKLPRKRAKNF